MQAPVTEGQLGSWTRVKPGISAQETPIPEPAEPLIAVPASHHHPGPSQVTLGFWFQAFSLGRQCWGWGSPVMPLTITSVSPGYASAPGCWACPGQPDATPLPLSHSVALALDEMGLGSHPQGKAARAPWNCMEDGVSLGGRTLPRQGKQGQLPGRGGTSLGPSPGLGPLDLFIVRVGTSWWRRRAWKDSADKWGGLGGLGGNWKV